MKSLAIVGMMFLSMGLFAQQSSKAEAPQKEKDKVCVKKCEKAQACDKMVKAPIRQVDSRKSSVRAGNGNAVRKHQHVAAPKANHQHRHRVAPLRKKSVKVDEKM